jgi:hypothetical protein
VSAPRSRAPRGGATNRPARQLQTRSARRNADPINASTTASHDGTSRRPRGARPGALSAAIPAFRGTRSARARPASGMRASGFRALRVRAATCGPVVRLERAIARRDPPRALRTMHGVSPIVDCEPRRRRRQIWHLCTVKNHVLQIWRRDVSAAAAAAPSDRENALDVRRPEAAFLLCVDSLPPRHSSAHSSTASARRIGEHQRRGGA